MDTQKINVFDLFQTQTRYVVPLFQRSYVWTREGQWQPLWEDILDQAAEVARQRVVVVGRRHRRHFLGAVVLNQVKARLRHVPIVEIIDGQQRLTTLQVLLAAIRDGTAFVNDPFTTSALGQLTKNLGPFVDADERFKVWPTSAMQADVRNVLELGSEAKVAAKYSEPPYRFRFRRWEPPRPRVVEAYLFFAQCIREYLDDDPEELPLDLLGLTVEDRVEVLVEALVKSIQLVAITLDQEDDAQVIFETLNARGEPLTASDLVRNFVFLTATREGANVQELYDKRWRPYEEDGSTRPFWKQVERQGRLRRSRMDLFLFHYITFRTNEEIKVDHLYQAFREWWERTPRSIDNELAELNHYGQIYRQLLDPDRTTPFGRFAHRLRVLDMTSAYPLILWAAGELGIDNPIFLGIAKDIESYFLRRTFCGLTTKGYNRLFVDGLRGLRAAGTPPTREAVRAMLSESQAETARWPSDDEFLRHLVSDPLYAMHKPSRVQMVLEAIEEASLRRFSENIEEIKSKLSIEHVLPQTASVEKWPLQIAENESPEQAYQHRAGLTHSLGNLTLVTPEFNSSLSNEPYVVKRPEITGNSRLMLNKYFVNVETWDEVAILSRGRALAALALTVWPGP